MNADARRCDMLVFTPILQLTGGKVSTNWTFIAHFIATGEREHLGIGVAMGDAKWEERLP
jgi:hypothetical protein